MHTSLRAVLLGLAAATASAYGQTTLRIATDHTDLVLQTDGEGRLCQTYFGPKLRHASDVEALAPLTARGHEAYATEDGRNFFEPALGVTHSDGNPSGRLRYVSSTTAPVAGGTQTDVVASFETIPNGFYLVRLVRESDGLILWEEAALTDRSYIEVLGTVSLSETEDGEELWVISAAQAGNAEFRVSSVGQYTAESALRDGSGTLTPSVSADGGATVFSYEAAAIGTGAVYEFRLYREEGGEQYLVERLYWMYG